MKDTKTQKIKSRTIANTNCGDLILSAFEPMFTYRYIPGMMPTIVLEIKVKYLYPRDPPI